MASECVDKSRLSQDQREQIEEIEKLKELFGFTNIVETSPPVTTNAKKDSYIELIWNLNPRRSTEGLGALLDDVLGEKNTQIFEDRDQDLLDEIEHFRYLICVKFGLDMDFDSIKLEEDLDDEIEHLKSIIEEKKKK